MSLKNTGDKQEAYRKEDERDAQWLAKVERMSATEISFLVAPHEGSQHGFLTAMSRVAGRERAGEKRIRAKWLCRCVCGKEVYKKESSLRDRVVKSCGCRRNWVAKERMDRTLM